MVPAAAADLLQSPNLSPLRRSRGPDTVLRRISVLSEHLLTPPPWPPPSHLLHQLPPPRRSLRRPLRRSRGPDYGPDPTQLWIPGNPTALQNPLPARAPPPRPLRLSPPPTLPRPRHLLLDAQMPARRSGVPNPNLLFLPSPEPPRNICSVAVRRSPVPVHQSERL